MSEKVTLVVLPWFDCFYLLFPPATFVTSTTGWPTGHRSPEVGLQGLRERVARNSYEYENANDSLNGIYNALLDLLPLKIEQVAAKLLLNVNFVPILRNPSLTFYKQILEAGWRDVLLDAAMIYHTNNYHPFVTLLAAGRPII